MNGLAQPLLLAHDAFMGRVFGLVDHSDRVDLLRT